MRNSIIIKALIAMLVIQSMAFYYYYSNTSKIIDSFETDLKSETARNLYQFGTALINTAETLAMYEDNMENREKELFNRANGNAQISLFLNASRFARLPSGPNSAWDSNSKTDLFNKTFPLAETLSLVSDGKITDYNQVDELAYILHLHGKKYHELIAKNEYKIYYDSKLVEEILNLNESLENDLNNLLH
ncbi:hypothetical protein SYNTR_2297 [Candidatus Syntrophocurvum alkaliphilum]|uniref:Uncharacterized protein n=1 Tax=Candidatus Syntrophocurvum alkaliphilum TaxID=2293317 RepID=A0A6I6DPM6_9FIRM|nr:hypothetical protein [Candidatus Syntrophocurvum alkaliphilum]QGU00891.1 hypothetical protein SYNTR_2297 [Candidatus Syntrophocurvum alkaliphilum]